MENDESGEVYKKLEKDLGDLAQRGATGKASEADTKMLRAFYDSRQSIPGLLNDFAKVCDRLTELAKKSLARQPLTDDDADWIRGYGVTLAGFHFYYENSYEVPRDDFPIVTRVFSNPLTSSMLYAGLARPQSLYVIVPNGKTNQLYRGAVMTYREFARPNDQLLDDTSWREMIFKGKTPPAPPFTRSFLAGKTAADWIKSVRDLSFDVSYDEFREILWQLGSQVTEKEVPELIEMMAGIETGPNARRTEVEIYELNDGTFETNSYETSANWVSEVRDGLSEIIAGLPWKSHQQPLISLLGSTNNTIADASAHILVQKPADLNLEKFLAGFKSQPPRTRRLYLAVLSRLPQQTDETRKTFLLSLRDQDDGVRWQAALAIEKTKWNDAQSHSALLKTLDDTNEVVAAMAARSLAQLGVTNAAPALFAKLQARLQSTNISAAELERQSSAVMKGVRSDIGRGNAFRLLDPDYLELGFGFRLPEKAKERAKLRLPPRSLTLTIRDYTFTDALIEALGDLKYIPASDELFKLRGGEYEIAATLALNKLAPQRLTTALLATAKNNQIDSYDRERALVTLCDISATNIVRELIPLLDDMTPIVYSRPLPGPEMRVCHSAAATIAVLLGWESRMRLGYARPEQRDEKMLRVREWAKQTQ